ncbi:MAG: protein kinase, partial [Treponema sp.]|nr:protein kinase [Treponema sp.]
METQILSPGADQVPEQTARQNTGTGLLQSGEAIQGYTIQNLLSTSGGEAEIYLCEKNGQTYVFKYFYNRKPDSEILEKLFSFSGSHPGIVSYIDGGTYNDRHFLILEYAKGGALDDKNPDGTYKYLPLSEDAVRRLVKETVDAFEICHANGIIHRDIKPGNLFYKNADSGNSGSGILIGDFGIASAFEADMGQSKHLTKAGNAQTIGYAAPEMSGGHKDAEIVIGKEVDYYALGVTVWVLLTGKEPFADEKGHPLYEGQIILDTIQGKTADKLIARSPQLSEGMKKLIRGFLTVRHDKRWGGKEVKRFLAGEDVELFAEAVRDLPPFEIAGEKYYQFIDVARALLEHREEGKNLVFKGKLGAWLIRIDQEFGEKIYDLAEDWSAKKRLDEGLVFIAYSLCPSLPFTVGDGKTLISLGEILSLLETNPEALVPFLRDEKKGFYIYLEAVGMSGIGDQVRKVVQAVNDDFKLIPRITVALKGNVIKPFQDKTTAGLNAAGGRENEPDNSKRELKEIDDLYNLPAYLKERVLLFIERRCGELPAWIENLTGKDLELWLYKIDRQRDALNAWGKWKYFTLFLRGNDIQCGEVFEEKGKKGFKDPLGN